MVRIGMAISSHLLARRPAYRTADSQQRFKRLADDAGVTVEEKTPTAKMGRRFWYTTYNEAVKQMMEGLEGIAADQGSASTKIVSQNYLSEGKHDATAENPCVRN